MSDPFTAKEPVGSHHHFIENSIPDWLIKAPTHRRLALKSARPDFPDDYRSAPAARHAALKQAVKRAWLSQNKVDRLFDGLADVSAFAEPLLREALKSQFGLELDVRKTFLRLYIPKGLLVGYGIKTLSLLDAALLNFEKKETAKGYFDSASCFISEPDHLKQFEVLPIDKRLSIEAFTSLCRRLDIGARYQRQLEGLLLPTDAMVKAVLAHKVIGSLQDRFRVSALLARMQGDITDDEQARLLGLLDGEKVLRVGAKVARAHQLQVLGAVLTGIVVFSAVGGADGVEPVIVYIPDDPEHPLKTYASAADFTVELTRRLRAVDYQRFFARFVAHDQRGAFFAALRHALTSVTWHRRATAEAGPAWRETPVSLPNLRLHVQVVRDDPWTWMYQSKLNKILNDARAMAVPTADEDRKSRWDQWDSLESVATVIVEVASLVAMPFVPFLGPLMLAYTIYQLLDDTFTGILDWSEGQVSEACEHLLAVSENLVQLGAFAVGGAIAGKLLALKPAPFVDSLKRVDIGAGNRRLWNPDLAPYEHPSGLPAEAQPDELGLHREGGATLLPLDGKHYDVEAVDGAYRIRHPQRPDAYQPRLRHNGAGAWAHEVERPMEWQGAQLFRRLGHSAADFSDATAARILAVSGIDEAVLRDMHVHARRPPALLEDTLRRFKLDQRIQTFIDQLQSADSTINAKADPQMQAHLLRARGVEVQPSSMAGGDLVPGVVATMDDARLKKLLGASPAFGDALPAMEARARLLRRNLARWAQDSRVELFDAAEASFEQSDEPHIRQMRRIFPRLPKTVAEEIVRHAPTRDQLQLRHQPGIPRSMAHEALFYLREVRLSRAYEGLYLDSVASADTDTLALHSLETLSGWSPEVRIEVRDGHFDGAVLDAIGRPEASVRKVLVRRQGQYQAHDSSGAELHGFDDLYGAVMHALPDAQRQALALPQAGQGAQLKQALRQQALLSRPQLRALLGQPPFEPGTHSPMRLAVGRTGYLRGGGDYVPPSPRPIEQRLRALYPTLSEEDMATLRRERLVGDPLLAMEGLENQYLTLVNQLDLWVADVPATHPVTGVTLSGDEMTVQRQRRAEFATEIQANWSRRLTENNRFDRNRFFFKLDILGDLPTLSADFSHVEEFVLINHSSHLRAGKFLEGFPHLKFLTLRGVRLDAFPVETFGMRELVILNLDNCNLRLDEATAEGLAHMDRLTELDLANNPLGLAPYLGYMKGLETLSLNNTGLEVVPPGLFELQRLRLVDLSDNRIVSLPEELFDVDDTQKVIYILRDNPLSESSKKNIADYFDNASLDRQISIQFDSDEALVWDNESDTEASDSGLSDADSDDEGR